MPKAKQMNRSINQKIEIAKRRLSKRYGWISNPPKPHFLGIGTQKGGTSSLYHLLNTHEEVFLTESKEQHFFSTNYYKGEAWYERNFTKAKPGQVRGEITPYYLFHDDSPERIFKYNRKMLLIVLLRNPVERTLSQYFHARRHGFENLNLEDALNIEGERIRSGSLYSHQKHSYTSRSMYCSQLDRYERLFKKKQLLVLKSEDFFESPDQEWQKIQEFLGVKNKRLTGQLPKVNMGNGELNKVDKEIKIKLWEKFENTNKEIKARYGFEWGKPDD